MLLLCVRFAAAVYDVTAFSASPGARRPARSRLRASKLNAGHASDPEASKHLLRHNQEPAERTPKSAAPGRASPAGCRAQSRVRAGMMGWKSLHSLGLHNEGWCMSGYKSGGEMLQEYNESMRNGVKGSLSAQINPNCMFENNFDQCSKSMCNSL